MAVWKPENIKMTSRGLEMLATVLGGDGGLTLTKVAVSQARHVGNLEDATGLESEVMELDIINVTPEKTGSSIEVQLNNKKNLYSSPFELHQIGVFMSHPNYGEQLYFIAQCEQDGVDFIPDYNETPLVLNYNLYIKHEGTSNVTINVTEGASTPLTDFNALKQRFEEHILTPHVTIQELEKLRELYTKVQIEQKLNEIKNGTVENAKKLGGKLASDYVTQQDIANFGGGDMTKAVYDRNNNGKVDVAERAESVTWGSVTGKPSYFPPSTHNHDSQYLGKNAKAADSNLLDGVDSSGFARSTQSYAGSNGFAQDISNQNITIVKGKSGLYMGHHVTGAPSETWYLFEVMCHNDRYVFVRAAAFADNPSYVVTGFWRDNQWSGWVADYNPLLPMKVFARFVIHKDQTLGARVITGVTEDGGDGHLFLNVYDKTKDVYFADATGAYHTLKELFQSSVDGKNTHINGINRLLGYGSGLSTTNSWNDVAWWWEHKVLAENTLVNKKLPHKTEHGKIGTFTKRQFTMNFGTKHYEKQFSVNLPYVGAIFYKGKVIPSGGPTQGLFENINGHNINMYIGELFQGMELLAYLREDNTAPISVTLEFDVLQF